MALCFLALNMLSCSEFKMLIMHQFVEASCVHKSGTMMGSKKRSSFRLSVHIASGSCTQMRCTHAHCCCRQCVCALQ